LCPNNLNLLSKFLLQSREQKIVYYILRERNALLLSRC
jgi:hypothetical protein